MAASSATEAEFIRRNFGTIWPEHLKAFTNLLVRLRERFDGDLDQMLVLAVIGDRTRPESWQPEVLTYRQLTRDDGQPHFQVPINIQSVADYSGIPRETVRRKVAALQEKGWVERTEEGHLRIARRAAGDLEESTGETLDYLTTLKAAFDAARQAQGGS